MHTEAEAKTKWCPYARVAVAMKNNKTTLEFFGVGGCNRGPRSEHVETVGASDPSNPESARCIASECMAWRKTSQYRADRNETTEGGYCGLSGTP